MSKAKDMWRKVAQKLKMSALGLSAIADAGGQAKAKSPKGNGPPRRASAPARVYRVVRDICEERCVAEDGHITVKTSNYAGVGEMRVAVWGCNGPEHLEAAIDHHTELAMESPECAGRDWEVVVIKVISKNHFGVFLNPAGGKYEVVDRRMENTCNASAMIAQQFKRETGHDMPRLGQVLSFKDHHGIMHTGQLINAARFFIQDAAGDAHFLALTIGFEKEPKHTWSISTDRIVWEAAENAP